MTAPTGFEVQGHRGYYRPQGEVTLQSGIALLMAATEYARSLGLRELILNATGFTGYTIPSVMDRYQFGTALANLAAGNLRIAQVMPADVVDPQLFGTLVANNRGLETKVFASEEAAEAWLDALTE